MKLKSFLKAVPLGVVCTLCSAVNAQPTVPVSPDAAALIKMVNYPVNFNTGVPDISVPLYSIESGNLSLPVTINYHAGGFKIHEKATRTGMGWSQSSDIQITRMVNGSDDLGLVGYIKNNGIKTFRANSPSLDYPINDNDALDNYKFSIGELDGMPDKFNYKLLNKSGSFYFRKNDAGNAYAIVPVPFDNIKITYVEGEFIIVDTDGTTYYFGGRGAVDINDRASKCLEITGDIKTAFKCSKIENANKTEALNFTYQLASPVMFNSRNQSIVYYSNDNPCGMDLFYRADQISTSTLTYESLMLQYRPYRLSSPKYMENLSNGRSVFHLPYLDASNNVVDKTYPVQALTTSTSTVYGISLARVDFRNGYVEFNGVDQLSSIKVKNLGNQEIKSFEFYHSIAQPGDLAQFTNANGTAYATRYLDSIKCSSNNTTFETYKFLYATKYCFGDHLQGKDAWGYANSSTATVNPNVGFTAIPETKITQFFYKTPQDACYQTGISSVFTFGTANSQNKSIEAVDELPLNAGMLRRIIYPTGGYVDFEYESNAVRQAVGSQQDLYAMTGGLRVKSISHYDGKSNKPATYKYYRYGDMEDGTGMLINTPYQEYDIARKVFKPYNYSQAVAYLAGPGPSSLVGDIIPVTCESRSCLQIKFTEKKTTYIPASSTDYTYPDGAPIYYTKVTEYNSDLGKMTGKKVYNYYPPEQFSPYSFSSLARIEGTNISVQQTDGLMGVQRLVEDYQYELGKFSLVHSKEFTYTKYSKADQIRVIYSFPKMEYNFPLGYPAGLTSTALYNLNLSFANASHYVYDVFTSGQYGIQVAKLLLSSESEKWYKGADLIQKTNNYSYTNSSYPQVSKATTFDSNGGTVAKVFKYAYDYPGVAICDTMKNRNMISQVMEEINYATNDNDIQVQTSQSKTNYAAFHAGMHILPAILLKSVGTNPLDTLITFDLYGDHENVLQLTEKNRLLKSYLWGYNDQYVIAEVNGASYYDATSFFNSSQISTATTPAEIKAIGNSISLALPNAMVSTYCYIPMIGVSAITAPDGKSKYFNYDGYGRLLRVKDDQEYIVKQYEYVLAKTPVLAKNFTFINNPMMLTFSNIDIDNIRRTVNAIQPAGLYSSLTTSFSANAYAEAEMNLNWWPLTDGMDHSKPEANVLLKLNTWPSGSTVSRAVYIDLIRDNSIVVSKRIPYNTANQNFDQLYVEPGEYKLGIRFEDNYNGSISKLVWGSTVVRSGDIINLQAGTEHTVVLLND